MIKNKIYKLLSFEYYNLYVLVLRVNIFDLIEAFFYMKNCIYFNLLIIFFILIYYK